MTTTVERSAFRIWRLFRTDGEVSGVTIEFTISARTEQQARELACDTVKPEDSRTWLDRRTSRAIELGKADSKFQELQVISQYAVPTMKISFEWSVRPPQYDVDAWPAWIGPEAEARRILEDGWTLHKRPRFSMYGKWEEVK
jgi:hypothetical protein